MPYGGRNHTVSPRYSLTRSAHRLQLVGRVLDRPERAVPVAMQPDHVPAVPVGVQHVAMPFNALAQHEERPRHALVAQHARQLGRPGAGAVVEGQRHAVGRELGRAAQQTRHVIVHPGLRLIAGMIRC